MQQNQLEQLLSQMTLDEKIGQLTQVTGDFFSDKAEERTGPMSQLGLGDEELLNVGTVLGVTGAAECRRIQTEYMKRNRLHIPTLFMGDVIHGCRTIFPIPLALGSSWNEDAARKMAEVSAREASAAGIDVTFSPMVDLVRDPRWGRVLESTGEDPLLNGRLAAAMVKGYQGGDDAEGLGERTDHVAACVKHFAAYGAAMGGRDYNTVDMSERVLHDMYLPGYKAALDAGAAMVMTSFNTVDGIPSTGNKHLMRDILREEMGFDGVLISDFGAVKELIAHGVAADETEAAKLSIEAGTDIEMMTICYMRHLREIVENGSVDEALIDEAVMRILKLKNDLGLFENPYRGVDEETESKVTLCDAHRQSAREIAGESIVLLRNERKTLPLDEGGHVALAGPFAASHDILGAWSWKGVCEESVTLRDALREADGSEGWLSVAQHTGNPLDVDEAAVAEAVELAKRSDVIVLALGEPQEWGGEAASRSNISLPKTQIDLYHAVRDAAGDHCRVVVVLFNSRPLVLSDIADADAIVEAWFPGTEGGHAVADILLGGVNPSARLSMSFPVNVGQIPVFYNCENTGRPFNPETPDEKYQSKYLDVSNDPAYPFGYGLSYSEFSYGPVAVSSNEFAAGKPLEASVEVANVSDVDGLETVQLYVRDIAARVSRPIRQLKDFKRVRIAAGETVTVRFTLDEADVRYVHPDLTEASDPGEFDVWIAPNSRDLGAAARVSLI
ncbi:beta-glucosidase BglX [Bifidobacterium longum]|uniref:beta-glucosidase BglX n=2 Tax=Bifidobacterium longum TaxID=216816 RepID=UPI002023E9FE|nr:beta-glucosidase BglX [Bifidobacterium longum]MDW3106946.1 beta-glucosidase BglX [Bifidobacterium longum]MDW3157901.1 beta-glucosidase BglX [Bifidobacterium longum]